MQLASLSDLDKLQMQNIATDTYDLLLSALEFAQVTSADKAADIEVGLSKLAVNAQRLPADFQTPIKIVSNHIGLILREQPIVNELLEQIEAIPSAERLTTSPTCSTWISSKPRRSIASTTFTCWCFPSC